MRQATKEKTPDREKENKMPIVAIQFATEYGHISESSGNFISDGVPEQGTRTYAHHQHEHPEIKSLFPPVYPFIVGQSEIPLVIRRAQFEYFDVLITAKVFFPKTNGFFPGDFRFTTRFTKKLLCSIVLVQ
jgi:hypothetical protein